MRAELINSTIAFFSVGFPLIHHHKVQARLCEYVCVQDVTNVLGQLRTMRFEREEEQEWLRELQQSLASAEERADSLEAALTASSAAMVQQQSHAAELQQHLLLQRVGSTG